MVISISAQTAAQHPFTINVDDQPYGMHDYVGKSPRPGSATYGRTDALGADRPQAYLVRQPPHSVTRPHFHQTHQFQVFVHGGGTVGRLRCDPVTVQFAAGHTPYGPIQAEADGVHYFTLRQRWDSGAKYLPEQREALQRGHQRQRVGRIQPGAGRVAGNGGGWAQAVVFEAEPDGLAAMHYVVRPGSAVTLPDAAEGGGQYHVVVQGALVRGDQELGPLSIEFASPDEGPLDLQAGSEGLEVLLLRFPR